VTVDDGHGVTTHAVTVWPSDVARYAPGAEPEALLEAAFEFLFDREPKESIDPGALRHRGDRTLFRRFRAGDAPTVRARLRSPCRALRAIDQKKSVWIA
jgi:hypothetical protein